MAWRAASQGPSGFSLESICTPFSGSPTWRWRCSAARWASVRMGMVAMAEAPAAKRKKERREIEECMRDLQKMVAKENEQRAIPGSRGEAARIGCQHGSLWGRQRTRGKTMRKNSACRAFPVQPRFCYHPAQREG